MGRRRASSASEIWKALIEGWLGMVRKGDYEVWIGIEPFAALGFAVVGEVVTVFAFAFAFGTLLLVVGRNFASENSDL